MEFKERKNNLKNKVLNNIDLDKEELFDFAICLYFPRLHIETLDEDDVHEDTLTITEVDCRPFAIKWKSAKTEWDENEFNEQPFECEFKIREEIQIIKKAEVTTVKIDKECRK